MNKKLIAVCAIALLVTGCTKVPKLSNGDDAVVSFKDNKLLSVNDLYKEVKDKYAINVLIDMIDREMLSEKYPETEEEKEQIETQIESWLVTFKTEAELLKQTQSSFGVYTMDGLRDYLSLQFKRNQAVKDYIKNNVTDSEIEKYYADNVFGDIKASHILIKPEVTSSMTAEEKTKKENEALQTAKDIIARIKNGEDFATLAKEFSTDEASASKGGDLGEFSYGKMVSEFEQAVNKLEAGKYTLEPVKTQFGYHIILKVSQKEKPSLESVKADIIDKIVTKKLSEDATLEITALMETRKNNGVKIEDSKLEEQYNLLMTETIKSIKEQAE